MAFYQTSLQRPAPDRHCMQIMSYRLRFSSPRMYYVRYVCAVFECIKLKMARSCNFALIYRDFRMFNLNVRGLQRGRGGFS